MTVKTKRLILQAMSLDEMESKASENTPESGIYTRHLARANEQSAGNETKIEWYFNTHWKILLKPAKGSAKGTAPQLIGDIYFKGKPAGGSVTIGYMIFDSFRRQGYGAEAVEAMVAWVESNEDVFFVDADVESDNEASAKLLEKCRFTRCGIDNESGRILYEHKKEPTSYLAIYMLFGMSIGMSLGSSQGNMAMGMSLGIAIGVGVGAVLDSSQKKKLKELEEMRNKSRNS